MNRQALRPRPMSARGSQGGYEDLSDEVPDTFTMEDLQQRLTDLQRRKAEGEEAWNGTRAAERYIREQKELRTRLQQVYVLMFNRGQDTEGIYTLWQEVSWSNTVLAFESRLEAVRYALMLKAQEFHSANVQDMNMNELKEFCAGANIGLRIIPNGSGLTPPSTNKEELEFDPTQQPNKSPRKRRVEEPVLSQGDVEAVKQGLNKLYTQQGPEDDL